MTRVRVTVDRRGRVLLPKEVRERLGLRPGSRLEVDVGEGTIELRTVDEESVIVERDGLLVHRGELVGNVAKMIDEARDERVRELGGR